MHPKIAMRTPLIMLAVSLPLMALGGCATRESVEAAQASANAADAHAADARGRADRAQARADEAAGIGTSALNAATDDQQKTAQLQADLDKANARIRFLQRNVVYKHVKHRKVHHKVAKVHHTTTTTTTKATPQPATGM